MNVSFPGLGLEFTVNRVAFSIFGFEIYWYALIIMLGFTLAVTYAMLHLKRFDLKADPFIDTVMVGLICGIIGARAYYVIFRLDNYDKFLDMINIRDGGLAIYGGVIAAFASCVVMCRIEKTDILSTFDVASIGFLIGQGIGRWGNFTNQEAFGCATDLPWGMYSANTYYTEVVDGVSKFVPATTVHPCFLYESIWCLWGFVLLNFISKHYYKFRGQMFLCYLLWYGLGRTWIEGLRTDSLWLIPNVIKVSQLISILCVIVASSLLFVGLKGISLKGFKFKAVQEGEIEQ